MLYNFEPTKELYIIGDGATANEVSYWVSNNGATSVKIVNYNMIDSIPYGSQCFFGFMQVDYRKRDLVKYKDRFVWPTFIHPSAIVDGCKIGTGTIIGPMVYCAPGAVVGNFCYISVSSMITHGTTIGENVICGPQVCICGSVKVGNNVFFGVGSVVRDKISITNDVKFRMTSIITKDIKESGVYHGYQKVNES